MPTETTVTRCGNCGAALDRSSGQAALQCAYCRQTTYLAPTSAPTVTVTATATAAPAEDERSFHRRLMRGPPDAFRGSGVRYSPAQMATRDVAAYERGLWPVGANASSTYGGSWSPSALLGPPRVYPRCGDMGGAWAPGPSRSAVEWVEVEYDLDVPAAFVRVFETNRPGSTFAVVDLTGNDEVLYEGPPQSDDSAQVLEVTVSPPRVIRRLRVYVVNPGWAELDTVGLLAATALPPELRTRAPAPSRGGGVGCAVAVLLALVVIVAGVIMAVKRSNPTGRTIARPALVAGGARFVYTTPVREFLPLRGVEWASSVTGYSSQYSTTTNSAAQAVGAPDVYPAYGDLPGAWASRATDGGEEWIEVRFAGPVLATSVLWAETLNPGAVTRVDDLSDPAAPAVLWEGVAPSPGGSSLIAELVLPAPRSIRALRIVLETRRVAGWNEIDAVGLARTP